MGWGCGCREPLVWSHGTAPAPSVLPPPPGSAPLAPFWETLQPMRNLQYSFSTGTGMLSCWTALRLRRFMGSITEALWREPRNGLRSAPGPAFTREISYPKAACTAMSSWGEQCQRLPFWLVVINSPLSLQNDDENQFPNSGFFFSLNGILASRPALA